MKPIIIRKLKIKDLESLTVLIDQLKEISESRHDTILNTIKKT